MAARMKDLVVAALFWILPLLIYRVLGYHFSAPLDIGLRRRWRCSRPSTNKKIQMHQNQRFEKRNATNPELVLMKDSCPWDDILGQKAVDIVEAYVYILSIIHGEMFSHHLLC